MNIRKAVILSFFLSVLGTAGLAQADEQAYGWQLMTPQERQEYQAKMKAFKTDEERKAFLEQHRKAMQKRAEAQGITLPHMDGDGHMAPHSRDAKGAGKGGGMGK